jgi:predicted ATPase
VLFQAVRLALFRGDFSLASACALGAVGDSDASLVLCDLAGLVAKSLVIADTHATETSYRLLATTRHYALERLAECQEDGDLCRDFVEGAPLGVPGLVPFMPAVMVAGDHAYAAAAE